ncbi:hypothetical protein CAEBREN_14170 [Caenorhabditis brenneri]|uniref:Uncharacterized protein n=1 Tax=Caenorhabditis brenneri TaxID=135651 RepID=G0MJK4_CAEBE|nr:hypothetical protein CAEBREN_14170 [Caenorhabditis brenneri]
MRLRSSVHINNRASPRNEKDVIVFYLLFLGAFCSVRSEEEFATEQCGGSKSEGCPVQYVKLGQPQMNDDDDIRMWNSWYLDIYRLNKTPYPRFGKPCPPHDNLFILFSVLSAVRCDPYLQMGCNPTMRLTSSHYVPVRIRLVRIKPAQ